MAGEEIIPKLERLSPEFALVAALETVPVLVNKVAALQPKKDWLPPFAFYISDTDNEDQTLDGWSGLQAYSGTLHLVSTSYRGLQALCLRTRQAIRDMRGGVYSTPEGDLTEPCGKILIEAVDMTQSSPDLFEKEVGYYRRMYTIRLNYQTEEVFPDED